MSIAVLSLIGLTFFAAMIMFLFKITRDDRKREMREAEAKAQAMAKEAERVAALSPEDAEAEDRERLAVVAKLREQKQNEIDTQLHGPCNPVMLCPHCGERGNVRTLAVTLKKGVSGGKATAALLTGGVSLLATGLSRKEANTKAWCGNCSNQWIF